MMFPGCLFFCANRKGIVVNLYLLMFLCCFKMIELVFPDAAANLVA